MSYSSKSESITESGKKHGIKQKPRRNATYWFALRVTLNYLSYAAEDHLSRDGTAHSTSNPPSSNSNQENGPPDMSAVSLMQA